MISFLVTEEDIQEIEIFKDVIKTTRGIKQISLVDHQKIVSDLQKELNKAKNRLKPDPHGRNIRI